MISPADRNFTSLSDRSCIDEYILYLRTSRSDCTTNCFGLLAIPLLNRRDQTPKNFENSTGRFGVPHQSTHSALIYCTQRRSSKCDKTVQLKGPEQTLPARHDLVDQRSAVAPKRQKCVTSRSNKFIKEFNRSYNQFYYYNEVDQSSNGRSLWYRYSNRSLRKITRPRKTVLE